METLFYIFVTTLPSHIIPFSMFWTFSWRSKKVALCLVSCNVLCKMAAYFYCVANGLDFRIPELLFAAVGFCIYVCFLRMDFFKQLFTYILIVDYLLVIRGFSSFAASRFFQAPSQGWVSSFVSVSLYLLTLPLLLRFFRQVAGQVYRTQAPKLWRTVWLIPVLFTILTLLFTNAYLENSAKSWVFLFCRVSLLVCVFVIYYVLLQALENLQKQIKMEQQMIFETHLLELQMEEQQKHTQLIMENAERTRQMRHDLRHQLIAIQALAGNANPQLSQYIGTLIQNIPTAVREYCENLAVNAMVSHYAALCQQEHIDLTVQLAVPKQCPHINDSSLCILFGNLLENAVEACGRMTHGQRFLRLNSRLEHGVLTITMDNSFDGNVHQENGRFRSSKRDDFGVGLTSLQTVVRAHGGNARFEPDGTVFHTSCFLTI